MDNFNLTEKLGEGAFAKVYKATCISDTQYAVKIMSNKKQKKVALESFKNEMRILSDMSHPNIVQYMGGDMYGELERHISGIKRIRPYIVTEYCSNGDFFTFIKDHGGLSEGQC